MGSLWWLLGRRTPCCRCCWETGVWVVVSERRSCSLAQVGGFKGKVRKARVSFRYRAEVPAERCLYACVACLRQR